MEKGLQAKDMAYALKITPSAYSRIENGKTNVTLETAHKISETLKEPIEELFSMPTINNEIKNGNNSPLAVNNSTLNVPNEKLIDAVLKLAEQINKNEEQLLLVMQNQNDLLKEVVKTKKAG